MGQARAMTRRARKSLLPQLLWGPQKPSYRRTNQVTVVRVPSVGASSRLIQDYIVSAVLSITLTITTVLLIA